MHCESVPKHCRVVRTHFQGIDEPTAKLGVFRARLAMASNVLHDDKQTISRDLLHLGHAVTCGELQGGAVLAACMARSPDAASALGVGTQTVAMKTLSRSCYGTQLRWRLHLVAGESLRWSKTLRRPKKALQAQVEGATQDGVLVVAKERGLLA